MLGDKALELIKQLQRCDYLSPMQDEVIKQVYEEMRALFEENQLDVNASVSGEMPCHAAVQLRHAVLLRDKRCILSYLYNRLQMIREVRWGFGAVLPQDVRSCLSESETCITNVESRREYYEHVEFHQRFLALFFPHLDRIVLQLKQLFCDVNWFTNYNRIIASYMSSIGNVGIDIFTNLQPPKSLYVQVRCLCDYGDFETSEGDTVILSKNSTHLLPRTDCEKLIHQGILEHISA